MRLRSNQFLQLNAQSNLTQSIASSKSQGWWWDAPGLDLLKRNVGPTPPMGS
jgi:hypothetical protein